MELHFGSKGCRILKRKLSLCYSITDPLTDLTLFESVTLHLNDFLEHNLAIQPQLTRKLKGNRLESAPADL